MNVFKYINKFKEGATDTVEVSAPSEDFTEVFDAVEERLTELEQLKELEYAKKEEQRAMDTLNRMRNLIKKELGDDVSEATINELITRAHN